jgi:hypothetical protein
MKYIFGKLSDVFAKYSSPTEHLAVDEIVCCSKVIFKHYVPKKHKWFGMKIYKLCDFKGYTYNMSVYLGRDRICVTATMTGTHVTVSRLTTRIEILGHKLYMDSFFSFPDLFYSLHRKVINCCGTVRPNQKVCLVTLEGNSD